MGSPQFHIIRGNPTRPRFAHEAQSAVKVTVTQNTQVTFLDIKREDLKKIDLPDVDSIISITIVDQHPEAVNLLREWASTGHFPDWTASEIATLHSQDEQDKTFAFLLLKVYEFAFRYDIFVLQDAIVDHFRMRKICPQGYFSTYLVREIYKMTNIQSGLRRYLIDSFLFKARGWPKAQFDERNTRYQEEDLKAFVNEHSFRQIQLGKHGLRAIDPKRRHPCDYHEHLLGVYCESGARRTAHTARLRAARARRSAKKPAEDKSGGVSIKKEIQF